MHLISVYSCDQCGNIVSLKTNEDFNKFDDTWSDTVLKQFCPDCKDLPEITGKIEIEKTQFQIACESLDSTSIFINKVPK